MKPFAVPTDCKNGHHRARATLARLTGDVVRSTCRCCGCDLVRTRATRVWIRSGQMG